MILKIVKVLSRYIPDFLYIQAINLYKNRRVLNLKNPSTFSEKITWLKLYDRTDLHTVCADKVLVKKYVSDKIGEDYIIPTVQVLSSVDDLEITNLPNYPIVIKTNHDSGTCSIVKDKAHCDLEAIKLSMMKSLNRNYYWSGREWQYKNIKRKILVEKMLISCDNMEIKDYKVLVFGAEAKYIQVDVDRSTNHTRNIYNTQWELQNVEYCYPKCNNIIEKPSSLSKMLKLSEDLAQPFSFARVDWYDVNGRLFFGEITFHPESGFGNFYPESWDKKLGNYIKI